jgi:hypothetical protein
MTQYDYLARTFNASPLITPLTTYGPTVGIDPLDTHDGDTSYVQADRAALEGVTWKVAPASSPAPTPTSWVRYRVQMWWRATVPPDEGALRLQHTAGGGVAIPLAYYSTALGDGWFHLDMDADQADPSLFASYIDGTYTLADDWWILTGGTYPSGSTVRATRFLLSIYTAGGVPLRLMQRGDSLGMGSGRVYATGTRQASTRVFGSL